MRPIRSMLLSLAAVLLLGGCGDSEPSEADRGRADEPQFTIGFSQAGLDDPWREQMNEDILAAAAEYPQVRLIVQDAENDAARQQSQVRQFVNQRVNLIIVSPADAMALTQPVEQAMERRIPVIVLDRAIVGRNYTCFISADNRKIGRTVGQWLVAKLGERGNVIEIEGPDGNLTTIQRHEGFREAIVDANFDLLAAVHTDWKQEQAREQMASILSRFDNINAVFAHNDTTAYGAYLAAEEAGRQDDMLFVGIDAVPERGIALVKQGVLDATFEYPTGGREAIDTAIKILAGQEVPKNITLGTRLFTPGNVDQGGERIP